MKKKEEKKISPKSILIGEKLVFKRRKIKTVGDLVKKNNKNELNKKNEKNTEEDYDDLTEEFFKKYFEKYNEYLLMKQKEEEKERKKIDSKLKELEKQLEREKKREEEEEDEYNSIEDESFKNNNYQKENSLNNSKENQINKNIIKSKQTFEIDSESDEHEEKVDSKDILHSLTSPLFNFNIELKKKKKKTAKFQKYISSVIINNCQLESLENIGESLNLLLPNITFEIPSNFKKIDLIQWLDLSNNKLSFIHKDISTLINLKILNLNDNLFTDINKITNLNEIKNLISLSFIGNKIIKIPGYRQFVIEMCPILQQLDSAQVTEKQLEIIHFGGSKFGEIRENGNGKVIKYPNPFERKKK